MNTHDTQTCSVAHALKRQPVNSAGWREKKGKWGRMFLQHWAQNVHMVWSWTTTCSYLTLAETHGLGRYTLKLFKSINTHVIFKLSLCLIWCTEHSYIQMHQFSCHTTFFELLFSFLVFWNNIALICIYYYIFHCIEIYLFLMSFNLHKGGG